MTFTILLVGLIYPAIWIFLIPTWITDIQHFYKKKDVDEDYNQFVSEYVEFDLDFDTTITQLIKCDRSDQIQLKQCRKNLSMALAYKGCNKLGHLARSKANYMVMRKYTQKCLSPLGLRDKDVCIVLEMTLTYSFLRINTDIDHHVDHEKYDDDCEQHIRWNVLT